MSKLSRMCEVSAATMAVLSGSDDGACMGDFAQCLLNIVRQAELSREECSDLFFNWYLEHCDADMDVSEAAAAFRELLPNCPMDEEALRADYSARV
jgi:hypothetical protein